MKKVVFTSLFVLSLLTFPLQKQSAAESEGPSVSGSFQISTDGGPTKQVEFSARVERSGNIIGETIFQDLPAPADQKADIEDHSSTDSSATFFARAKFDCLVVEGNKAVMGGSVTESNLRQYIGRRLLLIVQDGDGSNPPGRDKLTFGIYSQTGKSWLPMDSERTDDQGGPVSVMAQDSERPDEPLTAPKSEILGCQSFPLSSFSFIDADHAHGNIKIVP